MTSLSPEMAMTIDCDKLLSVPSGYLTPLPPTVNLQYAAKADYWEDDSDTPKQDPGQLAHLVTATDLHEKLTHLAEKQNFFEACHVPVDLQNTKPWSTDEFIKVPLPEPSSNASTMLPPPAPHAVPRGEYRKHRPTTIVSKGSVGHPLKCATACKYVKRKGGCRDGADCPNCHECFWSKATAKEQRKEATVPSCPGSQEELVEKVVRLLQEESHQVPQSASGWHQGPEINFMEDYGPDFVDYLGIKIPGTKERLAAGARPSEALPCNPGSMGHPYSCGPACKYVLKQKGCKDGDLCSHCHICRWTRYAAKHQFKI